MPSTQSNPFLLAADNSPELLPVLRANPSLAVAQDEHGYSLIHAAASYNHLDLLRTLVLELKVPVDLKDEDGETALFVCETTECARILVEELHADTSVHGDEGKTAREKIEAEGDFPEVAAFLLQFEDGNATSTSNNVNGNATQTNIMGHAAPVPDGISINVGTMTPDDVGEEVVDPEFKRRIEELAAREDFQGEDGQRELRELITEAIRGQVTKDREVRRRTD